MNFEDLKTNSRELKVMCRGYKHMKNSAEDISNCSFDVVGKIFVPYLFIEAFP